MEQWRWMMNFLILLDQWAGKKGVSSVLNPFRFSRITANPYLFSTFSTELNTDL